MSEYVGQIEVTFGMVLAAALIGGLIADALRVPKVTAYLLVGLLLGPSALDLLAEAHVHLLDPLTKLAMGLVLFNLGCQFPLSHLRRIWKRTYRLSLGELTATFLFVMLGMLLLRQSLSMAALLGALALATAPATTILVLKEYKSEGPVTELTESLVVLNNLVSIVAFEAIFLAIHLFQGNLGIPLWPQVGYLFGDLAGSLLLGTAIGLIVSLACSLLASNRWLVLLVAATTILLGVDEALGIPYMLSFLAMGLAVANSSDCTKAIVVDLDRLTGFLCVIFFVIHGAELDLNAFIEAGMVGIVYILLRSAGKYFGIYAIARSTHEPGAVRHWLGSTLLAQAGAAIALSAVAAQRDPQLGKQLQTIILGSVAVFEIAGPLCIRWSLLQAGEVPLMRAIRHTSSSLLVEWQALWIRIKVSLGFSRPWVRNPEELRVRDLVRRNVPALDQGATFDEIIALIEHSHDNTYAVVDDQHAVVGMIHYADISQVLLNRTVSKLVRAADIATAANPILYSDDPASKAMAMFRGTKQDCLPVVDSQTPHPLLGVVRRRDIVGYLTHRESKQG